MTTIKRTKNWK